MIDAEVTALLHTDPLLRHRPEDLPILCSDTCDHVSSITNDDSLEVNSFTAYVLLQQISAGIHRVRALFPEEPGAPTRASETMLKWWHQCKAICRKAPHGDTLQLRVLLSSTHMMCYVDVDMLERAIGRDGAPVAGECLPHVKNWATSSTIWRCVAYAKVTLDETEHMRLGSEPALHVARAVFQAGIVLLCFSGLGDRDGAWHDPQERQSPPLGPLESALDELFAQSLDKRCGANARAFISPSSARAMVFRCAEMLDRLRRWDLSGRLSDLLFFLAARSPTLFEGLPT